MTAMDESNPLATQAFWNEFMRRPDARAAYQAERRLQDKKMQWLQERRVIDDRDAHRKLVAEKLEEAPADLKKLIAPMFHIRVVEQFLWMMYDECQKTGTSFLEKLRDERSLSQLRKLREYFEQGGEERMEDLEKQWYGICHDLAADEERKKDNKPLNADMHTLKNVLEYGQECKRLGNEKFREGLYEEALHIYTQGDEVMKKWKVDKHYKNEHKWLKDYHLACLKNKAQAALKLERFQTALDAAEAALALDGEDHKAWYRKVLGYKGLGKFEEAEDALSHLEEVAQWCPDRRQILRDCEAERKRIQAARARHKLGTRDMLGKAFEAGVFSGDRERELEEAARQLEGPPPQQLKPEERPPKPLEAERPLERNVQLTAALAGELMDELAESYAQRWFQERVRKCARDSGFERSVFLLRLRDVAFEVQRPVLEKWGFEGTAHGVREMTAAIRECLAAAAGAEAKGVPDWLKKKQDRCLKFLYGGEEGGMLDLLM